MPVRFDICPPRRIPDRNKVTVPHVFVFLHHGHDDHLGGIVFNVGEIDQFAPVSWPLD